MFQTRFCFQVFKSLALLQLYSLSNVRFAHKTDVTTAHKLSSMISIIFTVVFANGKGVLGAVVISLYPLAGAAVLSFHMVQQRQTQSRVRSVLKPTHHFQFSVLLSFHHFLLILKYFCFNHFAISFFRSHVITFHCRVSSLRFDSQLYFCATIQ